MRNPLKGLLRLVLSLLGLGFLAGTLAATSMRRREGQGDLKQDLAERLRRMADRIEESGLMGEEEDGESHPDEAI